MNVVNGNAFGVFGIYTELVDTFAGIGNGRRYAAGMANRKGIIIVSDKDERSFELLPFALVAVKCRIVQPKRGNLRPCIGFLITNL